MDRIRPRAIAVASVALLISSGVAWRAGAQTTTPQTTQPTTATTVAPTSPTTRPAPTTSRPASTTTTTSRKAPTRLTFTASSTEGSPGTSITVASVSPCRGTGSFYVLLSVGPYRLGSGPADNNGNWRFNVSVPQVPVGTYGLGATCLISRNGVDENAGIYIGPDFTVTAGAGGPSEPTTPDAHKSGSTGLLIGLIVAVVVALAAIAYAVWVQRTHRYR